MMDIMLRKYFLLYTVVVFFTSCSLSDSSKIQENGAGNYAGDETMDPLVVVWECLD